MVLKMSDVSILRSVEEDNFYELRRKIFPSIPNCIDRCEILFLESPQTCLMMIKAEKNSTHKYFHNYYHYSQRSSTLQSRSAQICIGYNEYWLKW